MSEDCSIDNMILLKFQQFNFQINSVLYPYLTLLFLVLNIAYLLYLYYELRFPSSEQILRKKIDKIKKVGAKAFLSKEDIAKSSKTDINRLFFTANILLFALLWINNEISLSIYVFYKFLTFFFLIYFLKSSIKPSEIILPKIKRKERIRGVLNIGNIISNRNKNKFLLEKKDLKKHVFITGLTGMGKTNLIQVFLKQITKNMKEIPFLLTEFKGEYSGLKKMIDNVEILKPGENFTINIFDPIDEDPNTYAEKLLKMFISGQIITFSEEYSAQMEKILIEILSEVCSDINNRNWEGFDYYSKIIKEKYKKEIPYLNQTLISINNRLRRLRTGALKDIFETSPKFCLKDITRKKVILDLSNIIRSGGDINDAIFFANLIFNTIWMDNLSNGKSESIRHFTIIEDAIFYSSKKNARHQVQSNYIEDMAFLLRGTGECLITINTRPTISEDVMANAGVTISFQLSYDRDIMGKLLVLRTGKFYYLTKLNVGECLIKVNSISTPFLLKVPKIFLKKEKRKREHLIRKKIEKEKEKVKEEE
ncbi:MAG: ATP-binding protein, partial [archaeon]|nr:ATP-binding protein [archaeon]